MSNNCKLRQQKKVLENFEKMQNFIIFEVLFK